MCIGYHALNKVTIKINYLLPRIDDLLDRLNGANTLAKLISNRRITKFTLQMRMLKMAMRIRYSSYEFLVMQFGLCNASSTFTTFMNSIFHEKLDEFLIIYIDDILVYSKILKDHVEHFEYVLNKLRQNKLFVNRVKNEFSQ